MEIAENKKNLKNLNVVVPSDIHKLIKLTAIEKDMTVSKYVRDAIYSSLMEDGKLKT